MLRNAVMAIVFALVGTVARPLFAADAALSQRWQVYGTQLYAQKQYDKAIGAFSNAAKADQRNAAAWKGLGNCYYAKRDYANSLKYYKYAYQLNPADAQLGAFIPKLAAAAAQGGGAAGGAANSLNNATRFYQAKQYDQAIQWYNHAISQNPNDAKAWQGLGNCYYAKQDKVKAVDAYKRALQINPSNTGLQNFLANYAPETATGPQVADGPKDWAQPLWRSAVLPGWGQAYNGQGGKGLLLGGLTLGLFAGTVATYMIGDGARQTYLGLTDPKADFDGPYNTWESMANLNHIMYIGFGVAYSFTLVDAILGAKPASRGNAYFHEEAPALQFSVLPGGAGVNYRLMEF